MSEQMEVDKIYLSSSKKLIHCNVHTLKIPNFTTLPEYEYVPQDIRSPSFEFANATWCFRIYTRREPQNVLSIDILRLKSEIPEHFVCFKITLLELDSYHSYVRKINQSHNDCWLYTYCNIHTSPLIQNCDTLTLIIQLFQFDATKIDSKSLNWTEDSPHNEMKDGEISLRSTKKCFFSDFYSLKLFNWLASEPKKKKVDMDSPTFKFAKTACCFQIYSESAHSACFRLKALNGAKPIGRYFMKYILKDSNNKEIDNAFKVSTFSSVLNFPSVDCFKEFKSPSCTLFIDLLWEEELEEDVETAPVTSATNLGFLSGDFRKLFLNGVDCDLTLRVAEREFQVHRLILKARSEVFEAMLSHDMIEKNKGIIDISDIDAQTMELLLLFIYSGEVGSLNRNNVFRVYYAADKYNLAPLKKECAEFMIKTLTPLTICDVMQLALDHNDQSLLEDGTEYFVNHAKFIFPTAECMAFQKANPIAAKELVVQAAEKSISNQFNYHES